MSRFRSIPVCLFALAALSLFWVPAVKAEEPFEVSVPITQTSIEIPYTTLPEYDSNTVQVQAVSSPLHGTLTSSFDSFTYAPGDDFWQRGGDSFSYTQTQFGGIFQTATVSLVATLYGGDLIISQDFEPFESDTSKTEGFVSSVPEMAISGVQGLKASVDSSNPDAHKCWLTAPFATGGNQGNRIRLGTVPPGGGLVGNPFGTVILSAKSPNSSGPPLMQIWLENDEGNLSLRGQAFTDQGTSISTSPRSIGSLPHRLDIGWWPKTAASSGGQGGFYFWVDDLLVGGFQLDQDFYSGDLEICVGFQGHSGQAIEMGFDALEVGQGDLGAAASVEETETFEDPLASSWTPFPAQATSVGILAMGAITGDLGVSADLGAAQGVTEYLLNATPRAQEAYNVSFLLDTSDARPTACDSILIFGASDQDTFSGSAETIKLLLRKDCGGGTGYQIKARGRHGTATGTGAWQDSAWSPLTNGIHRIELGWRAASGANAANGYLRLWVDGIYTANITGLANQDRQIEALFLGALGVAAGGAGELAFDDFTSWIPAPLLPSP